MKRSKQTKKALTGSVLALVLCFVMLIGTTFAWFTDTASTGVSTIQSGTLEISLEQWNGEKWVEVKENEELSFLQAGSTGGSSTTADDKEIEASSILWEPNCTYALPKLRVVNNGNLAVKFRVDVVGVTGDSKLAEVLEVVMTQDELTAPVKDDATRMTLSQVLAGDNDGVLYGELPGKTGDDEVTTGGYIIALHMRSTAGNEYQDKSIEGITLVVRAAQNTVEFDSISDQYDAKAEYDPIPWDGTTDTDWYNDTDISFTLETAEELAGLAQLVNDGNDFDGKTITLASSVDLAQINFTPIGSYGNSSNKKPFNGTFNGNGHTVSNMKQAAYASGQPLYSESGIGLFGYVEGATIKNLTVSDSLIETQGKNSAMVAGIAKGSCTFENITVASGVVANYNNATGGIVGWTDGTGTFTFKNITLGADAIVASLWGSPDSLVGGIVGEATAGATYIFENVNIACRLDVYNDVCSNYRYYNYRNSGMLIGYLAETTNINGTNYPDTSNYNITCTNVTVTYGDWANYHYCQTNTNAKGQRLENNYDDGPGYTHTDHSACLSHNCALIEFDQLFGGTKGVKGLTSYTGVTVVYNNK